MSEPTGPSASDRSAPGPKHFVTNLALIGAIIFVFGSATVVIAVAVLHCLIDKSCSQLNGLSHVIMAWAGAIIAGAIGCLGGRRQIR